MVLIRFISASAIVGEALGIDPDAIRGAANSDLP